MRGSNYNVRQLNPSPGMGDKIISAASYLTGGLVGFVMIILSFITKSNLRSFVKFHAYQSIFISVCAYVIKLVLEILLSVLSIIPFIGKLVLAVVFYVAQMPIPILLGMSLLQFGIALAITYLVVTTFMGKYSEIPWISDNIKRMM